MLKHVQYDKMGLFSPKSLLFCIKSCIVAYPFMKEKDPPIKKTIAYPDADTLLAVRGKTVVGPGPTSPDPASRAAETRTRVRQATLPLRPDPRTPHTQVGRPPPPPSLSVPGRHDTGEQERLFPAARWMTGDDIRQRHLTPIPTADELRLGPVRPILDEETIRVTVSFANRELNEIRRAKENGDYRRAHSLGENLWQALFHEQFDWPSYFFLAEVAARMCFLFDPLREMNKIEPWQQRLQYVLHQLRSQSIQDRALYYHIIALISIDEFFSHVQRYLHALAHPGTKPPDKGWEFFPEEWKIYLTRLESFMAHRSPGSSAGEIAIELGPRSDYLFSTIRHERLRMEAVSHGDRYRWDPSFLMRDRDSAIATMPFNSDMQKEIAEAERMTAQYIGSFWTPKERQTSPLVASAEISRVRYALDRGKQSEAKRLSDTLISRFSLERQPRKEAQLLTTRGQGFLVLGELLSQNDDPRLMEEARALKGSNGNRMSYADRVIDDGLADMLRALQILESSRQNGHQDFARMCRSFLLAGMTLKLEASGSLPRELQLHAPRLFDIGIHDLPVVSREDRSFVFLPRLARAWNVFRQHQVIDFDDPQNRRILQEMMPYVQQSLHDLDREATETDQSIDIPLEADGTPRIVSARYFDDAFRSRKRPHVPQAYSERVRQKHRFVAHFVNVHHST